MNYKEMYERKKCSAEEAVKLITNNGVSLVAPLAASHPRKIFDAMAARKDELTGVGFFSTLDFYPSAIWKLEDNDHILVDTGFIGGQMRAGVHKGIFTYSPVKFTDAPREVPKRFYDTAACVVSPMDKHGYFSMGCSVDYTYAAAKSCKSLIVEVNKYMPRTHGKCWLHISEIDALVENDVPLPAMPDIPLSDKDKAIGKLIADQTPDGACIQIGIGAVPNAVALYLEDKNDLGVHTEMLTDSIYQLTKKGNITNRRKNYRCDVSVATFAVGSKEMYGWMDDNPGLVMLPVNEVNDPYIISQNDNVIAVNAALSVDLTGQVCSESFGPVQWSNVGGQLDFVQGAYRSKGGKSFITLYSTAKKETVSRITPQLAPGSHITCPRTETHYVVTEYGIALIRGLSARQRALNLIEVAHPDFRDELRFEARKLGLI